MKSVTLFAFAALVLATGPALACNNDTCSNLTTTPGAGSLRPQQEAGADRAGTAPAAPSATAPAVAPMSKEAPSFTGAANRGGKCGSGAVCN